MSGRIVLGLAVAGLLTLLPSVPGRQGAVPAHAAQDDSCRAEPPGGHDPKAQITFTAVQRRNGRTQGGHVFDYGKVRDLMIEIRWERVRVSTRQRLELYAPDGNLFQMFPEVLPELPEPSLFRVPVGGGSWIMSGGLSGTWCAKVFLGNDLEPIAAESFELRRP